GCQAWCPRSKNDASQAEMTQLICRPIRCCNLSAKTPDTEEPQPRLTRAAIAILSRLLSPSPIRRHARLRQPRILRWRARLPEHVDRDAAARVPVAGYPQPERLRRLDHAAPDHDGAFLVEGGMVAERHEEQLQRLRFHQQRVRRVVDDEMREVGLAGDW